jgi:hypothetical protein
MTIVKLIKFLFLLLVFYSPFYNYSQTIDADYKIEIHSTKELKDSTLRIFGCFSEVKSVYKIKNNRSLNLNFSAKLWIVRLGVSKLNLKLYDTLRTALPSDDYSYTFNNGILKILLKKKISNFILECNYRYFGSTIVNLSDNNYNDNNDTSRRRNIIIFGGESFDIYDDMFFSNRKVKIENKTLVIIAPRYFYVLTSLDLISERTIDSTRILRYKFNHYGELSNTLIALLDTMVYTKNSVSFRNNELSFYINKDHLDSFNLALHKIIPVMQKIISFEDSSNVVKKFDIVDFFWHNKKYAIGRGFNNLLMVDWSFFTTKIVSIVHEFLHTQFSPGYVNSYKGDFIINESLIEYLANYFMFYQDQDKYAEAINKKRDIILNSKNDSIPRISIYKIIINNSETAQKIYVNGPVIIYDFAKMVGEDKFVKIVITFFLSNKDKGRVKYEDFINFLSKNNIDKKLINEFDKKMKSKNETII